MVSEIRAKLRLAGYSKAGMDWGKAKLSRVKPSLRPSRLVRSGWLNWP